ncbi:MAG: SHOCT domain-containing protein [Caulobacteraceae bacterium]|nr:SHOCT domain-containing protein [Caulobacteraceae bacterium]
MTEAIERQDVADGAGGGAAWAQLQSVLISGESVVACALQHRLYALWHRRHLAAATTGRFIFLTRRLLGGYDMTDVRWQDLKEARLSVGMISASLTIEYSANLSDTAVGEGASQDLHVSGLRIEPAQALYRECQAQGQVWREKRRVRSLEEMRANAGGVQIATGLYPRGPAADVPLEGAARIEHRAEDPAQRLARAKEMLVQGLITDAEFEAIKAKIIGSL